MSKERLVLEIVDTAGREEFYSLSVTDSKETLKLDEWVAGGEGFLIMYSITDRDSFARAAELRSIVQKAHEGKKVPMVLIGNKSDLKQGRCVTFEQGEKCALDWGCPFLETSAKTKANCKECFRVLVKDVHKRTRETTGAASKRAGRTITKRRRRMFCVCL